MKLFYSPQSRSSALTIADVPANGEPFRIGSAGRGYTAHITCVEPADIVALFTDLNPEDQALALASMAAVHAQCIEKEPT